MSETYLPFKKQPSGALPSLPGQDAALAVTSDNKPYIITSDGAEQLAKQTDVDKAFKPSGTAAQYMKGDGSNQTGIPAADLTEPVPVNKGGTGNSTLAAGQALVGNGAGPVASRVITDMPANGSTALMTAGGAYNHTNRRLIFDSGVVGSGVNVYNVFTGNDNQDDIVYCEVVSGAVILASNNSQINITRFKRSVFAMSAAFNPASIEFNKGSIFYVHSVTDFSKYLIYSDVFNIRGYGDACGIQAEGYNLIGSDHAEFDELRGSVSLRSVAANTRIKIYEVF